MRNNLKEYRISNGLSQQDMADAIGISRPQLSKIERGLAGITDQVESGLKNFDPSIDLAYIRGYSAKNEQLSSTDESAWKDARIEELEKENKWLKEVIKNLSEAMNKNLK
ncbi:MAG: helix-turn-helix domain-containing protein [Bacteroidota bacterium]